MAINPISIKELIEKLQNAYEQGATHCTVELSEEQNRIIFYPIKWIDGTNQNIEIKDN